MLIGHEKAAVTAEHVNKPEGMMRRHRTYILLIAALFAVAVGAGPAPTGAADNASPAPQEVTWTLAVAGDAIMTRQVRSLENDPAFAAILKPIREAYAAAINFEQNVFRLW